MHPYKTSEAKAAADDEGVKKMYHNSQRMIHLCESERRAEL